MTPATLQQQQMAQGNGSAVSEAAQAAAQAAAAAAAAANPSLLQHMTFRGHDGEVNLTNQEAAPQAEHGIHGTIF